MLAGEVLPDANEMHRVRTGPDVYCRDDGEEEGYIAVFPGTIIHSRLLSGPSEVEATVDGRNIILPI